MISVEYTITDLNQLIYNFAFDYLKKKYVKVSSKNTTTGVVTNCTYGVHYVVMDKTIELLQSVGAVGDVLRIVRETSTSEQIVSWNDASILKASDMSLAQLQQLHILEEYSEYMSTSSLALDVNGQYDAKNSRVVNLATPQDSTDAVNRGYIDSFIGTLTDAQTSATLAQSWAVGDILSIPKGSSKEWATGDIPEGSSKKWAIGDIPEGSSKKWAIGDILSIPDGSSKYWSEQSKNYAELANGGFNFRKSGRAYVVGDVVYSSSLPTWARLDCIQGGTTASTEPTWGIVNAGKVVTDGTVKWQINDVKSSGDEIGTIKAWLVKSIPAGWLDISTGAMVSRATYPELWAWVQANAPLISEAAWQTQANAQSSVGAFSTGDGSTTFRLPKIIDYVRGGVLADVGKWQSDAIRNITGWFNGNLNAGGAFENHQTGYGGGGIDSSTMGITFDASKVVPTADENRPKTIKMVYCIKAFGIPVNQGLIDITALANEVAGKENKHAYIRLWDEKTSGTVGGTFTSGAWRTRDLNQKQVVGMSVDAVTIASNQFTLPAGTYEIEASVPAYAVDGHKGRLQNITDGNTVLLGTSERSSTSASPYAQTRSIISGSFTITAQKTFEIQHYAISSNSSTGYGYATSISGLAEIYTQIIIRKVG